MVYHLYPGYCDMYFTSSSLSQHLDVQCMLYYEKYDKNVPEKHIDLIQMQWDVISGFKFLLIKCRKFIHMFIILYVCSVSYVPFQLMIGSCKMIYRYLVFLVVSCLAKLVTRSLQVTIWIWYMQMVKYNYHK